MNWNQLRAEKPTRKFVLGFWSGKGCFYFLLLFTEHFVSSKIVKFGPLNPNHECPHAFTGESPSLCKQQLKTRTLLLPLLGKYISATERKKWLHNSLRSSLTFTGSVFCQVDQSQHNRWSLLHHPRACFTPGMVRSSPGRNASGRAREVEPSDIPPDSVQLQPWSRASEKSSYMLLLSSLCTP